LLSGFGQVIADKVLDSTMEDIDDCRRTRPFFIFVGIGMKRYHGFLIYYINHNYYLNLFLLNNKLIIFLYRIYVYRPRATNKPIKYADPKESWLQVT